MPLRGTRKKKCWNGYVRKWRIILMTCHNFCVEPMTMRFVGLGFRSSGFFGLIVVFLDCNVGGAWKVILKKHGEVKRWQESFFGAGGSLFPMTDLPTTESPVSSFSTSFFSSVVSSLLRSRLQQGIGGKAKERQSRLEIEEEGKKKTCWSSSGCTSRPTFLLPAVSCHPMCYCAGQTTPWLPTIYPSRLPLMAPISAVTGNKPFYAFLSPLDSPLLPPAS